MVTYQRIRDPLHNLIEFEDEDFERTMWDVVQTQAFQRLRRVKQLGFSDLVYPGATHSRFAHSLGVFHTARQLMNVIKDNFGNRSFNEPKSTSALAAALLHDLGHGPFSHAFEDIGKRLNLKMASHEAVTDLLIKDSEVTHILNKNRGSGFANDVAKIIGNKAPSDIYSSVVSSQFDADRLDYMRRDRLMTGTYHGSIDYQWLLSNLKIGKVAIGVDEEKIGSIETFVLGEKAVYAAESYVVGLFQLYPTVYFHKTVRGAEKLFSELLCEVIKLVQDDDWRSTGLTKNHAITKFAMQPDLISFLALDDAVMSGALHLMSDAKNKLINELAIRIIHRQLFKSINIREKIYRSLGPIPTAQEDRGSYEDKVDTACHFIEKNIEEWMEKQGDQSPSVIIDKAERPPYKSLDETKGPLNQIRIQDECQNLVDLGERSRVVRAMVPFKLFRIYVREEDDDARKFINQAIEEGVDNVKAARS